MDNDELDRRLREARTGNYGKLARGLRELVDARLDLARCTPAELQRVYGIGPKTSRFWILWTRPGARYAALDVHVLRWLRSLDYQAPASTPANPKLYDQLERAFLAEADRRGLTPRELDFEIWQAGSQATNKVKGER
jgi:thermostable 8-oxoguanine DNA glycosylase